jgi:hypothetical protein
MSETPQVQLVRDASSEDLAAVRPLTDALNQRRQTLLAELLC